MEWERERNQTLRNCSSERFKQKFPRCYLPSTNSSAAFQKSWMLCDQLFHSRKFPWKTLVCAATCLLGKFQNCTAIGLLLIPAYLHSVRFHCNFTLGKLPLDTSWTSTMKKTTVTNEETIYVYNRNFLIYICLAYYPSCKGVRYPPPKKGVYL